MSSQSNRRKSEITVKSQSSVLVSVMGCEPRAGESKQQDHQSLPVIREDSPEIDADTHRGVSKTKGGEGRFWIEGRAVWIWDKRRCCTSQGSCVARAPSAYGASRGRLRGTWSSGRLNLRRDMLLICVLERLFWRFLKLMMYWSKIEAEFPKLWDSFRENMLNSDSWTPCLLTWVKRCIFWRCLQVIQVKQLSTEVDFMVVLEMICLYPEPLAHKCCLIWRKDHCTSSCIMWVGPKCSYIYPERQKIRRMWCNLDCRDWSDIAQGKDRLGHLQQGLCPFKHSHSLRSCRLPDLILWPLEFWANSFPVF